MSERKKVIKLRKIGKTYGEINNALGKKIPKSTLSYWLRGVKLGEGQKKRIREKNLKHLEKIRKIAVKTNKEKHRKYIKKLERRNSRFVDLLNRDVMKISLAMLYLGEGGKWKSHRALLLGSSDPNIIKLYLNLLRSCYGIDEKRLRCRVMYRADQNINHLQRFWSQITKIPQIQFYKTKPDPRSIGKPTKKRNYKGVCAIHYGSTEIQLELEIIAKMIMNKGPWYSGNTHPWHG